jgi:hypothetical protein
VFTLAGTVAGVYLFLHRSLPETEPAVDVKTGASPAINPAGG